MAVGRDDRDAGGDPSAQDPERFRVLVEVASRLIDELVAEYQVERIDGKDLDLEAATSWPSAPATRLVPAGGGAPITWTFTPFPGVMVHYGHHAHGAFPSCGCDMCDESPSQEVARLTELVSDVVAGRLTESRRRRLLRPDTYGWRLESHDGSSWHGTDGLTRPKPESLAPTGTTRWAPWLPVGAV